MTKEITIVLAGNSDSGKSTVFDKNFVLGNSTIRIPKKVWVE